MSCPVCYGPSRSGECRACLTIDVCGECGVRADLCKGHHEPAFLVFHIYVERQLFSESDAVMCGATDAPKKTGVIGAIMLCARVKELQDSKREREITDTVCKDCYDIASEPWRNLDAGWKPPADLAEARRQGKRHRRL